MREKFTKIAIRMVAVLATVMLCLPLVVSTTTVSVYAAGDVSVDTSSDSDTMTNPYEITIPAVTTIDSTDKTGSVSFHGKLNKYNTMSIAVSSANSNKMVNGSYDIDYTMDKSSFSYDTDDAIKSFSDSINFEVTSTAEVAGTYSDQLTFAISVEAKAVEVTVNHNDGAGTTSTVSLPIGSAVLASLPTLTREGYKFDGWTYTDASGNEVEIDENTIYDGTITEFNAKWMSANPVLQKGTDFNKNIASTVTAIEFTTEAMPSSVTSYTDVSEAQDGSILAYMDGTTMKVSPKYDGMTIYANKDCSNMFNTSSYNSGSSTNAKIESITFNNFNTSKVTNMSYMFYRCSSLTSLYLNDFNTGNVTNMKNMFNVCSGLTVLDLSSFDTSKVTDMSYMFSGCSSLAILDVTKFDTSKVTDMSYIFSSCRKLTSLDVSKFNTSSVTNMNAMFLSCFGLTSLNLSNFNTSKVTSMSSMFNGCSKITSFDLSSFDTTNVTSYNYVFSSCTSLSQITVGDKWVKSIPFPTYKSSTWYALSSGTGYTYNAYPTGTADTYTTTKQSGIVFDANGNTFANGSTINIMVASDTSTYQPVVVSDTGKVFKGWATTPDATVAEYKADGSDLPTDKNLKLYAVVGKMATLQKGTDFNDNIASTVTAIEFTTEAMPSSVTDYTDVSEAQDGSILAYMDGTTMKVSPKEEGTAIYANENCYNMFNTGKYNFGSSTDAEIKSITFNNFNTSKVIDMSYMFYDCEYLTSLNAAKFDTSKVTNMSRMFDYCIKLTSLDVTKFDTNNVTDMSDMFRDCQKLTSLDVTNFNTSEVTDMSYMFYNCENLTSLNVTNFNTSEVTDMSYMFSYCRNLTSLDVTSFDTSKATTMNSMFSSCQKLASLDVTDFNTSKVTDMGSMFFNCLSLTFLDLSKFDTSNVTNMPSMFSNCKNLTSLDVTGFDTSKVTNMGTMFYYCSNLKTIYASSNFVTTNVTSSSSMFFYSSSLVGGNGTKYNSKYVNKTYARIDTASTPGYFTLKSSDEEASDTDIVSVVSLEDMMVEKSYTAEDFSEVAEETETSSPSQEESSSPSEETSSHLEGTDKVATPSAEATEQAEVSEAAESSDESSSDSAISAASLFTPTPSVSTEVAIETPVAQATENNNGVSGDVSPEITSPSSSTKYHLNSDEELDAILEANVASVRIEGAVVGEMPEYDEEKFVVEIEEESGALVISVVDGAEVSAGDWKSLLYSDMFESIGEECKISVEVKGVETGTVFEGFEEVVSSEE